MVPMVSLQLVNSAEDILRPNVPGFNSCLHESVYKDVLFALPHSALRFMLESEIDNTLTKTRYSPVLAYIVVLRASKID